ncbi:MAG: C40 family peptidase [Gammaproteobacteria bacterium]|nr:C40 family peptidase [Gammaproteobacteria bacterium]
MRILVIVFFLALLWSCQTSSPSRPPSADSTPQSSVPRGAVTDYTTTAKDRLMRLYQQWKGTPYRLGGLTRNGIDCSGFVYLAGQQALRTELPRTTYLQSKAGRTIARQDLTFGDLIFFKTDRKTRHVGIYLGDGHFMHASTRIGVTITRLDNPYWQERYWMARRVKDY